ncbi:hypothetical protein [Leifsonia sp. C5G2]|uniref:hypothetical protein n=1 Tax=Leifsonia sp. C5G2 TaxID=2735269 RepID=UPI0015849A7C|nr:hypothetical protein [Leifsonia sp. C5G2]NUU07244.1 hypothetical protein [Leifsonia sp. C5G2]
MLHEVRSFVRSEHRYTLYEGGSWVLFEDHDEYAEEIGTISRSNGMYATQSRSHPQLRVTCPTLDQAVETVVTIHETGGKP